MPKTGILLINTGTPESPTPRAVKNYLKEFLSDPRVMNFPASFRFILVNGIIVPFRARKSARKYKSIWTETGSPLLIHTENLADKLEKKLGAGFSVKPVMRYGQPSITKTLEELKNSNIHKIIAVPLFPQYSSATTGSVIERLLDEIKKRPNIPDLSWIQPFYNNRKFVEAVAENLKESVEKSEHLLISFHGLPESHIKEANTEDTCKLDDNCCQSVYSLNKYCYRAQCYETARLITKELNLDQKNYSVSFQSRLGRAKWLEPYTSETVEKLAGRGIKKLAVICPSFVADCLETLEEIGMEAKEDFIKAGGVEFNLAPCLNSDDSWVEALSNIIMENL